MDLGFYDRVSGLRFRVLGGLGVGFRVQGESYGLDACQNVQGHGT